MELIEAFDRAQAEFDRRVHQVTDGQWSAPTPCTEWTVRDLVNHLVSEHLWAPWLLRGATVMEVGDRFEGDVLGDDPVAAWEQAATASHAAFHDPHALEGTVDTSGGPTPAEEYAWQMTSDLTVHAWDLARGIGADSRLDEELAAAVYDKVAPQANAWQGMGIFAPPVPVREPVKAQDKLVALLGRQP
ncbi:TIGR03086 family metal-binding protein [Streptomyces gobiensis]|uniref:TIGR03086 family metal-binding protein n=1 Tax=Streptomyces gobiensis TaxID=2875706 RepID=UPI001E4C0494|nr:TIGR03086 family metal-binding protein [Streptomyces gobiensis]UGY92095.1 TIGR03086 family protein [Streptomyces gobiensis]